MRTQWIVFLFAGICAIAAGADLTIKQAVEMAVEKVEIVLIKQGELQKAEYAYKEAKTGALPSLSVETSASWMTDPPEGIKVEAGALSAIPLLPSEDMIFVKAEAKKDTALRDQYEIAGFPTVILMKSSGEEIDRIYGYLPPKEFVSTIQSYLQGKETLEDIKNRFQADSTDVGLAFKLADKYEARRRYDEAVLYYKKVVDLDPEDKKGKSKDALFNIAWVEIRKKDYPKAVDAFKYFLKKYPESEMAQDAEIYIPYSYAKADDTTRALELYQKFLVDHPDSKDTSWVREKIEELKEGSADSS